MSFFVIINVVGGKMKIYIIGPVASGKSTLARKIAKKYNIKYYELDNLVWDDALGIKRTEEEIINLFNKIIKKKSWVIEDVGRNYFKCAYDKVDIIYYIKLNPILLYIRILKRWIKQKCGFESFNYKPTLKGLIQMFKWARNGLKKQKEQIKELQNYNLVILNSHDIKNNKY